MGGISEQLGMALADLPQPTIDPAIQPNGLLIKVARLRNDLYPGRGAQGVLPILVTGHEAMNETEWSEWVRKHGIPHYGAGYTERVIRDGIELKEMLPTAGFGRHMRGRRRVPHDFLELAGSVISAVEQWPDLYNQIVTEMGEQEMTLAAFLQRVHAMPVPWDTGVASHGTLGDIVAPGIDLITPNF